MNLLDELNLTKQWNDCVYQNIRRDNKSRKKKNPETYSIKFKISSKTPRGEKGQHKKDTIIYITSDSMVNSNYPYRWSPASLTFNNYFYLFLYLYLTWITINNNAPHLKSPKNQNRKAALGRPAIKITGGLQLVCGWPTLSLSKINLYFIKDGMTKITSLNIS